jgi:hypothetical protein
VRCRPGDDRISLRNITATSPVALIATDGWQHWQTEPVGDSYASRLPDPPPPRSLAIAVITMVVPAIAIRGPRHVREIGERRGAFATHSSTHTSGHFSMGFLHQDRTLAKLRLKPPRGSASLVLLLALPRSARRTSPKGERNVLHS